MYVVVFVVRQSKGRVLVVVYGWRWWVPWWFGIVDVVPVAVLLPVVLVVG